MLSYLQLQGHDYQQIGSAQLQQKTGFRLHDMRILVTESDGFHFDLVAADFLSERSQVGCGGHDIQLARSTHWGWTGSAQQRECSKKGDAASVKGCVLHNFSEKH